MKKILALAAAIAAAAILSTGFAYAADPAPAAGAKADAAAKDKMKGTIKSIDPKKGELVVTPEGGGADVHFKITKNQGKIVKAGDAVTVSYTSSGADKTATRITKAKEKAAKAKKPIDVVGC